MGDEEIVKEVRKILTAHFEGRKHVPDVKGKRGVFVTLKRKGRLRGCIGVIQPVDLKEWLVEAALGAIRDPRFPPVQREEVPELEVEVTLLGEPEPLGSPEEIEIGKHGLIVEYGPYRGLLLPQVAVEYGWGPEEFLDHTCIKAGLPPGCWTSDRVKVYKFEGVVIGDSKGD